MFGRLFKDITGAFADILPHQFSVPCFTQGLIDAAEDDAEQDVAQDVIIGVVLAVATPEVAAVLVPLVPVAFMIYGDVGIAEMIANWHSMSDNAKSKAIGELLEGQLSGGDDSSEGDEPTGSSESY